MPGMAVSSSRDASLTPLADPKRRSSVLFRLGPMPGTASQCGLHTLLGAASLVVSHSKSVGLVPEALHQEQGL